MCELRPDALVIAAVGNHLPPDAWGVLRPPRRCREQRVWAALPCGWGGLPAARAGLPWPCPASRHLLKEPPDDTAGYQSCFPFLVYTIPQTGHNRSTLP